MLELYRFNQNFLHKYSQEYSILFQVMKSLIDMFQIKNFLNKYIYVY